MKIFGIEELPIKTGSLNLISYDISSHSGGLTTVKLECLYRDDDFMIEDKYTKRIKELEAEVTCYKKMLE